MWFIAHYNKQYIDATSSLCVSEWVCVCVCVRVCVCACVFKLASLGFISDTL